MRDDPDGTVAATRPQLVIFDLDGTLTDSAEGIVASFRHALGEIGADVPDGDLASRIVGPPMHHTLHAMGLGEHADAAIAAYRADYTTRGWAMNSLFDGIPQLLADLRAAGVRLAVATSKAEPTARRILEHFGLDGHFEVIAGASLDGVRATKADVVAHALAQLEPLPERVLMVGDRAHDVEGAAAHGIDTVVVGWGYGQADFARAGCRPPRWRTCRRSTTCARCSVSDPLHVTFVCSGNICRSPMAEKMFAHQISERGLADDVRVTSAGTGDWHAGEGADDRANRVLRAHGYPDRAQRRRRSIDDHLSADLVVALGRNHVRILRDLGVAAEPAADVAVVRPAFGCACPRRRGSVLRHHDDFEDVFTVIEAALPGLHDWVDAQLAGRGIAS